MRPKVTLAAFDLDGTLLRGDTVLEAIARPLGRLDRTREFEGLTRLEDIKAAREETATWYKSHSFSELCSFLESMQLALGVEDGLRLLKHRGVKIAIVSITWEFAVEWWARKLGADFYVGTRLSPNGDIAHFWPNDKPVWLAQLAARLGIPLSEVAAVGDSPSDVPILRAVGLPFYVGQPRPKELPEQFYCPDGNIYEIAETIVSNPTAGVT